MCTRTNLVGLFFVAAVGAGCGGVTASSDAGGGAGGGGGMGGAGGALPPTVDQACSQFAQTFCGRLTGCAPYAAQILYGDMATCMSRVVLGCMRDLQVPDTNQTTTDMTACARDAANSTCSDLLANMLPASCQIKPGLRLNGEGCGSSWQCMSTHCERTTGDCGVCAPRAAAAGACTSDDGCMTGLVCAAQKCVAPAALNAACSAMAPCRADLYCSTPSNTCKTPLPLGSSCMGDTNGCDYRQGVSCNIFGNPQMCETVAAAKGGQACGLVNNTLTLCIEGNSCNGISLIPLSTTGTCPAPAGDGEACTDSVHCLPPANCVGGLCRLPSSASCTR